MTRVEDRIRVIELEAELAAAETELAMTTALRKESQDANAVVDAIETLRKYGSIHLHANNQEVLDHNGHETIGVSASTPEWFDREFTGATLLEALTKAVEAKERKDT
jgi:hypothetical protein